MNKKIEIVKKDGSWHVIKVNGVIYSPLTENEIENFQPVLKSGWDKKISNDNLVRDINYSNEYSVAVKKNGEIIAVQVDCEYSLNNLYTIREWRLEFDKEFSFYELGIPYETWRDINLSK